MKNRIEKWYKQRLWTQDKVKDAVEKGVITESEYEEITGEVYAG